MANIKIRCTSCNLELLGKSGKTVVCNCSNMASIKNNETVTAMDLSKVVMISQPSQNKNSVLNNADLMWQEERRKRKVRKLDFEVR